jgi:hypothetical protein
MAEKKTVVFGIYQNSKQAERIVPDLLAAGFSNDAISFAHDKNTEAPAGTAAGAATGGVRLSVHCDTAEQITHAKDLLKRTGAQEISSSREEAAQIFVES